MKNINVIGDIDEAMFKKVHVIMGKMEANDEKEVQITLSSAGGSAMAALAIFDRFYLSPMEITVIATGLVASAAVVILAGGDNKLMTPSAWVMVHEEQMEDVVSQNVTNMEHNAKNFRSFEDQWNKILAANTKIDSHAWAYLHRQDTYLTPEKCIEYGLVDKVVTRE